ncbi:TIGR01459 family HAD-type hydrolase [Salipiger sp. IMCC34102]|uniref:TIGR01459 family HAD-type hydrolase n=1 Tax=Salipiger sp. IMCC34102 TaxID=2510647 RepID=UPI00101C7542|nr:TIGR01459 family HAD-type hydrolase [Salipiger sp. IMCC34102]RYH03804.1 TIGR01459 family HAD-type hydrolase [Salipiger sp. IMCC34102]
MTQIIDSFLDIAGDYDAAFVDLWGCVHDGLHAHEAAVGALQQYRRAGGRVVLVTNSPRPWGSVQTQIAGMGVPDDAWDAIATSGDSARAAMFRGVVGQRVWFIGEDRDHTFFEPMELLDDPLTIERVPLDAAEGIVCCGPTDPMAHPDTYRPQFLAAKQRGLKLLCANPDIVVDRGEVREWCAGALAQLYTAMGGESLYFGKPHPPIYDLARRRLTKVDDGADQGRILCIGDGIQTDILGAQQEDLDSLFISGGLAAQETQTRDGTPDAQALERYLQAEMAAPTFTIGSLR